MQPPRNQHPNTRWASKTVPLAHHTTLTSQKPAENLSTTQGLKSATMGSRGGSWEPLDCFNCLRGLLLLGFLLMARAIGGLQGCNSGGGGWGAALCSTALLSRRWRDGRRSGAGSGRTVGAQQARWEKMVAPPPFQRAARVVNVNGGLTGHRCGRIWCCSGMPGAQLRFGPGRSH